MTVWVVRGAGISEEAALATGILSIHFSEARDLANVQTLEDMREMRVESHPEETTAKVNNAAGQLWSFKGLISVGDLIVMPCKKQPTVAIGRMAGDYKYRAEAPDGWVHSREVTWINTAVLRSSLDLDLHKEMTYRPTIYRLKSQDAEKRLLAFAGTSRNMGPGFGDASDYLWDAFIGWAKKFYEWDQFDERERDYKLTAGAKLAGVKQALWDDSPDWENLLGTTLRNPDCFGRDWRTWEPFLKLDHSLIEAALRLIWAIGSADTLEERVRRFQELGAFGTPGLLVSIILMGDDPTQFPMYRYASLKQAYRLTGFPSAQNDSPDAWIRYEHSLKFYDEFITQASYRGLQIRDALDAQSLVWCVTQYGPDNMPEDWSKDVKGRLNAYREGNDMEGPSSNQSTDNEGHQADTDGNSGGSPTVEPVSPYSLEDIVKDGCFLEREQLVTILGRLQSKKNVILQGPPGTGKTWLAKRLAFALIGGKSERQVRPFQFHPNLSYEDFVRGWRPAEDGKLDLVDGPFLNMIGDAAADQSSDYVVVIEEINRGNPAQILGEMLTLLETDKRTPADALALSYPKIPQERVYIPPNLYVIGTMNVADRSLALVDLALRRRFAFIDLEPTFGDRWREWVCENYSIDVAFLSEIEGRLTLLNQKIAGDASLGPQFRIGHSVVTPVPSSSINNQREWFRDLVQSEIGPLLDEYWFDNLDTSRIEKEKLLNGIEP